MEFLDVFMPAVWFVILALFLLLYVILDGFDLGRLWKTQLIHATMVP